LKNLLYIGNKLAQHGLNPTAIETLGPLLEQEGFRITYASSKRNQFFRMIDMLWSVFRNQKVDYVLIDTYSTTNFWYAFITSQLCRFLGLSYIPLLHGGNLPIRLVNNRWFCQLIFQYSYCNVSPSHYLLEAFQNNGFTNMVYIPNTIEIKKYPFLSRNIVQPRLLWVRSFSKIYNPLMAVEVLFELKKKYPQATLCMVGPDKDGILLETQKRAKERNITVVFKGKLTQSEWITLSEDFDIFINTTHFDNMPVSVIEAMSLGLAVVSTNVGGIPFLLKNNEEAILVGDNAMVEMVLAIEKLVENQVFYKDIISNARTKAISFDWLCVKEKWIDILK
jgi:glycosyltransferase involved in cell wall biosynthesis